MYYKVSGTDVNVATARIRILLWYLLQYKETFFPLFLLNNAWFCLSPNKALFKKIFQMLFYGTACVCEEKVKEKKNSFQMTLKISLFDFSNPGN